VKEWVRNSVRRGPPGNKAGGTARPVVKAIARIRHLDFDKMITLRQAWWSVTTATQEVETKGSQVGGQPLRS
jgi:hypothetical protein